MNVENLAHSQLCDLVSFFTRTMDMDTRVKLMGTLPAHYAALYPDVDPSIIQGSVEREISQARAGRLGFLGQVLDTCTCAPP